MGGGFFQSHAPNDLRLDSFRSLTEGLTALSRDIRGLPPLLSWQEPIQTRTSEDFTSNEAYHLSLQPRRLPPVVEGDSTNAKASPEI